MRSDALPQCRAAVDIAWSPDSTKLAYYSDDDGVTVLNTGTWDTADQFPGTTASWSPDSTHLAATVFSPTGSGPEECAVVVRDVSAQQSRTLTAGIAPYWSPDGDTIVFSSDEVLHTISPNGDDKKRLAGYDDLPSPTSTPSDFLVTTLYGTWSPDSTMIAVSIGGYVWTFDLDTLETRIVSHDGSRLVWSPDGAWLAYSTSEEVPGATPSVTLGVTPLQSVIYIVPANGSLPPQRVIEGNLFDWR